MFDVASQIAENTQCDVCICKEITPPLSFSVSFLFLFSFSSYLSPLFKRISLMQKSFSMEKKCWIH